MYSAYCLDNTTLQVGSEKIPHADPDTGRTGSGCDSPLDSAGAIELGALAPPQGTSQYSDHGEAADNQEEHEAGGQEEPGFQFSCHDVTLLDHICKWA